MPELTAFQHRFLQTLATCPNATESTTYLAIRLKSSRAATASSGRALVRAGYVVAFRSDDSQWAVLMWALCRKGVQLLELLEDPASGDIA